MRFATPMKFLLFLCLILLAGSAPVTRAAAAKGEIEWELDANMDRQLFPALLIATATQRPEDDGSEPDPLLLGDPYGSVGVSITVPGAKSKVQVTVQENSVMHRSTWEGVLEKSGTQYYVAPRVNYNFEALRRVHGQVPLNVTMTVEVNGKSLGEKTQTLTLRTINDCPFAVSEAEETIDDERDTTKKGLKEVSESGDEEIAAADDEDSDEAPSTDDEASTADEPAEDYTDMGWMFAAYVNENSPIVDTILKEALATKIVDSFAGYQKGPEGVALELFAIWTALQNRGIKYSNVTTTPAESRTVYSQNVRFPDESITLEQANCVDGSVLFASILRKLGLRAFLVTVPGHMFMGVYLKPEGEERVGLETTMIGTREDEEKEALKLMDGLGELRGKLDKKVAQSVAWKTFATALALGTQNLEKNAKKFEAENEPQYQVTDIDDARHDGIMPIAYLKE